MEGGETAKGKAEATELTAAQQRAARRVAEAKATIPHLYVEETATVAPVVADSLLAHLVRASGLALRQHPRVNGSYGDGRHESYSRVNVGFVADGEAPAIPVVPDADRRRLDEIAGEIRGLKAALLEGSLEAPQLSGGTFTVTSAEAERLLPVIVPGQAAMLASGAVRDSRLALTLACDHRVLTGSEAARFLASVRRLLEDPSGL